tara:strand:+ start:1695 stop:2264 length:570 start_codon:yes stop_codon:yes gene_type:complete
MDPIEAQIQAQLNNIKNQQGFSNYTPSFEQNLQPQGIAPLINSDMQNNFVMGPVQIDPKEVAENIIKNQAVKFASRKLGLGQIGQNVLGSMVGLSSVPFAPLTAVSALTGVSSGIANVLRNKRVKKAIMRDVNRDKQGDITTVNLQNKGSPNPYSGGSGGVQSGMASQGQKDAGPGFSGSGSAAEMGSF